MLRGLPTIRSSTRLCSLNKPRRFNVPSRFYTAAPTPEIVADYTTTKAKGSLSKKILWLTLLTGTLYTGSTYFALKNEAFHDTYITYFPGGEQLLDKLDDWAAEERTQQYYRKWIQLKEKTAEHTETARKYANTTKETAQDWYEYVSDAIAQFRGEKEPPLPPGSNPPTPVGGGNNARLRQQRLRMAAAKRDPLFTNVLYTSEKQPIPKFDLSEHDVVNQFAKTVQDLVVLLNEADMSGHAKRLVDFATRDIESLNKAFALIKQEENKAQQEIAGLHQALLASKKHLDSKQQEVEQKLQDAKARATAQVDQHIQELELKLKKETDSLNNQHKETREKELATQRQEYLQLLENELKQKAIEIQSEYASQVQQQVETERGGRLSKIDHVSQKQIELEKLVYADAELLDDVKKAHQLVAAIDALKRAALTGEQGKFVAELEALNRLSQKTPFAKVSERQNSELIQLVIKSINVHVANHGVTSLASLSDKFETVAREVRRASLIPDENASMMAHLVSIIFSSFMFKKKGLVPGDDVESRLARAEYYLNTEKDLESAAREINQLTGWPKRLSMDWLEGARRHLEVKQALDILKSEASLISMLQSK
ncbi:mitochondrial inner membrane protein-domain-containing protein [Mycotypha africana]|uniref:mitochondrial inner membrane protein-domain-containing protein n=1 Tax=Mycotypha africana TaxID=64632 RepID=UPI0023010C04|nr:mitochondrial inner membrane protein-domain-containing protein [Mycotypha africana]KAI8967528.1 mitochondrial inner membrane protein-domain-containing protein [Mycotypha africana]